MRNGVRCGGSGFFSGVLKPDVLKSRAGAALRAAAATLAAAAAGPAASRDLVPFPHAYPAGVIVIRQGERMLYFVAGEGRAIRYRVAVGRTGRGWLGETFIEGKYLRPSWTAPADVRRDHPGVARFIPGGSPRNPMGAAALMLGRDELAIHGTSKAMRKSIGAAASYGCIRMYDEDVVDLFGRVRVGTRVVALP
ncbi:L,D-transpeptidase [Methylocella sp.]|uniref:L,D-transpeptidase n=1 Tax=Methylocella sp. TaxID=1978226 RepID=UPI0037840507